MFKKVLICSMLLGLSGCWGYNMIDGDLTGQVKKVTYVTPIICSDYIAADISLGVMKNGTGSMSTQDMWFTIEDGPNRDKIVNILKEAAKEGSIVNIKYNSVRLPFCTESNILTDAQIGS